MAYAKHHNLLLVKNREIFRERYIYFAIRIVSLFFELRDFDASNNFEEHI